MISPHFFISATGIARSVQPGQALRGATAFPPVSNDVSNLQEQTVTQVNYPLYPSHSTLI